MAAFYRECLFKWNTEVFPNSSLDWQVIDSDRRRIWLPKTSRRKFQCLQHNLFVTCESWQSSTTLQNLVKINEVPKCRLSNLTNLKQKNQTPAKEQMLLVSRDEYIIDFWKLITPFLNVWGSIDERKYLEYDYSVYFRLNFRIFFR